MKANPVYKASIMPAYILTFTAYYVLHDRRKYKSRNFLHANFKKNAHFKNSHGRVIGSDARTKLRINLAKPKSMILGSP